MRKAQVVQVVSAELDGGVREWLHLSCTGSIPGKTSICSERKNTQNILHRIMDTFYAGQGLLNKYSMKSEDFASLTCCQIYPNMPLVASFRHCVQSLCVHMVQQ